MKEVEGKKNPRESRTFLSYVLGEAAWQQCPSRVHQSEPMPENTLSRNFVLESGQNFYLETSVPSPGLRQKETVRDVAETRTNDDRIYTTLIIPNFPSMTDFFSR